MKGLANSLAFMTFRNCFPLWIRQIGTDLSQVNSHRSSCRITATHPPFLWIALCPHSRRVIGFAVISPELAPLFDKGDIVGYLNIFFRMLMWEELAAAMSYEGQQFTGTREEKVKQIGNGVPKCVAEALCYEIFTSSIKRGRTKKHHFAVKDLPDPDRPAETIDMFADMGAAA
jgi:hypothetical protein